MTKKIGIVIHRIFLKPYEYQIFKTISLSLVITSLNIVFEYNVA